jgi:hypothetical protein
MKSITALVDHTLTWSQPKAMRSVHELRFGPDLVATLQFPKMLSSAAVAESGDGRWALERTGVLNTRVIVRKPESDLPLATYTPRAFKTGGKVQLASGKALLLRRSIWESRTELVTEGGEPLVEMQSRGFFRHFVDVKINRRALQYEELPCLVMLLFYSILLRRRDAATHSAVH